VKTIYIRGLTEATHGNACGIGMAEFTNRRTAEAVDRRITAINSITGGHAPAAAIPIWYENDREVLENAFPTIGLVESPEAKVLQIANTLQLGELLASRAYLPEVEQRDDLEILDPCAGWNFDAQGNLPPVMLASPAH